MKGRILFALLFAALMALGISSLNDLQAQKAALPVQKRAAAYIAVLPPSADQTDETSVSPEKAPPVLQASAPSPRPSVSTQAAAPQIKSSYYLACYQAFHYSDCAG